MSLVAADQELYTHAFALDAYSAYAPGERFAPLFLEMTGIKRHEAYRYTVLDAGCGSGKGSLALAALKFQVRQCDFIDGRIPEARLIPFTKIHTLWDNLKPQLAYMHGGSVDFVFCTDVLEHIRPEFTMLTVARLLEMSRRGVFLSISLVEDVGGYRVGQPLHTTVRPFVWWRDRLNTIGHVTECRDLLNVGIYFVRSC